MNNWYLLLEENRDIKTEFIKSNFEVQYSPLCAIDTFYVKYSDYVKNATVPISIYLEEKYLLTEAILIRKTKLANKIYKDKIIKENDEYMLVFS
jgi:hypothetical protein